jgi:hypothetical protein
MVSQQNSGGVRVQVTSVGAAPSGMERRPLKHDNASSALSSQDHPLHLATNSGPHWNRSAVIDILTEKKSSLVRKIIHSSFDPRRRGEDDLMGRTLVLTSDRFGANDVHQHQTIVRKDTNKRWIIVFEERLVSPCQRQSSCV